MRYVNYLNFDWEYSRLGEDTFTLVDLPHANILLPYNNFDEQLYQFKSIYRKVLPIEDHYINKRLFLHFLGVMTVAEVILNGRIIGIHKGGYTPFKFDITDSISFDQENILEVVVDSTEREDTPPFGRTLDYLTYGGIYREVYLEVVHELFMEQVFVKTTISTLGLKIVLNQKPKNVYQGCIEVETDSGPYTYTFYITEKETSITQVMSNIQPWNTETPHLYPLKVTLIYQKACLDDYSTRVGFRDFEFKEDGFYLNGCKTKLIGLNRHQSYPYVGYAMPKQAQYEDAEILKHELGVNIVRLSHYPQSDHFIDRCDELGILVFSEIPGWQHIGDSAWQDIALKNVEEMILHYFNHPSIILWGVRINESVDSDSFYQKANFLAHRLDETRPTGGVRNFANSHVFEDVYTYNDFIHQGNNRALNSPKKVIKKAMPYLVTEHNGHMYPTKKYDQEDRRVEQALRHLRVIDEAIGNPRIAGAIGWCLFDYNTHKEFGSSDRICYHGVLDLFRIPKLAAYSYASQGCKTPILNVTSGMEMGEKSASKIGKVVVLTNCDYVELFQNGEYISTFKPDRLTFPHLAHPPIIIDDFIGERINKTAQYSRKDARILKQVFISLQQKDQIPLWTRFKMGYFMLKNHVTYREAYELYTHFVANWGDDKIVYEFKGYVNKHCVITVKKGPSSRKSLEVKVHHLELIEDLTYDVSRVEVHAKNEYGDDLIHCMDPIHITIDGPLALIGPSTLTLIGGSIAFWVKTQGVSGIATVTIKSQYFAKKEIQFTIKKVNT